MSRRAIPSRPSACLTSERNQLAMREAVIAAGSRDFYRLPEEVKEQYYGLHVTVHRERYSSFDPLVFYRGETGALGIARARGSGVLRVNSAFRPARIASRPSREKGLSSSC